MSHRHYCPATNHYWICEGIAPRSASGRVQPSICMCPTHPDIPMDEGNHSTCRISVLACSDEHLALYQKHLAESSVDIDEMMSRAMNAAEQLRFEEEHLYMEQIVFAGINNCNTDIDSPLIFHFNPVEYATVIDRCEALGIGINGIEVFSTDVEPPWKAALVEVETFPGEDLEWARRIVHRYEAMPNITLCGTYSVPDSVLESSGVSSDPKHVEKWQKRRLALEQWSKRECPVASDFEAEGEENDEE